jgi:hypothetical protein
MRPGQPVMPGEDEEILALEDRVPFERPAPVAVRSLPLEEPTGRRATGLEDPGRRGDAGTPTRRGPNAPFSAPFCATFCANFGDRPGNATTSRGNRRGLVKLRLDR